MNYFEGQAFVMAMKKFAVLAGFAGAVLSASSAFAENAIVLGYAGITYTADFGQGFVPIKPNVTSLPAGTVVKASAKNFTIRFPNSQCSVQVPAGNTIVVPAQVPCGLAAQQPAQPVVNNPVVNPAPLAPGLSAPVIGGVVGLAAVAGVTAVVVNNNNKDKYISQ